MKEFGSDFHYIDTYHSARTHLTDIYSNAVLLADGRQCIVALIRQYEWKRIWMPEYFCYEVIDSIKVATSIDIAFYHDYPLSTDDGDTISEIPFREGDVLFRVNYFGLREFRSNSNVPVPVIEDHTHDLLGHWALYSDADWCIASLRKSLPLPEGGMIWSPKGHILTAGISRNVENEKVAAIRWEGMRMKADYLNGIMNDKEAFRKRFLDTEGWFDHAEVSAIDWNSREYIENFDINAWHVARKRNWYQLHRLIDAECLLPQDDSCTPFSFVILTDNHTVRECLRRKLIDKFVYPVVLWKVPDTADREVLDLSQRLLSIHCDGRYSDDNIHCMAGIINESL